MNDTPTDARELLSATQDLQARSRRLAHRGAWLPALVLGLLPVLSIVLYRSPFADPYQLPGFVIDHPYWAGLPSDQRNLVVSYAFWMLGLPAAFAVIGAWYSQRERRYGLRVGWRIPLVAATVALLLLLALVAAPEGVTPYEEVFLGRVIKGLLTPLIIVGVAVIAHGVAERSIGITLAGAWLTALTWQFCALNTLGGIFGWQTWLLTGGDHHAPGVQMIGMGGQITVLGLDRPGGALLIMSVPLLLVATYRAVRAARQAER